MADSFTEHINSKDFEDLGVTIVPAARFRKKLSDYLTELRARYSYANKGKGYIAITKHQNVGGVVCPVTEGIVEYILKKITLREVHLNPGQDLEKLLAENYISVCGSVDFRINLSDYISKAQFGAETDPTSYTAVTQSGKLAGILVPPNVGLEIVKADRPPEA